jgi:hypothetical protein
MAGLLSRGDGCWLMPAFIRTVSALQLATLQCIHHDAYIVLEDIQTYNNITIYKHLNRVSSQMAVFFKVFHSVLKRRRPADFNTWKSTDPWRGPKFKPTRTFRCVGTPLPIPWFLTPVAWSIFRPLSQSQNIRSEFRNEILSFSKEAYEIRFMDPDSWVEATLKLMRSTSSADKNFAHEITWITWKTEQNLKIWKIWRYWKSELTSQVLSLGKWSKNWSGYRHYGFGRWEQLLCLFR